MWSEPSRLTTIGLTFLAVALISGCLGITGAVSALIGTSSTRTMTMEQLLTATAIPRT